MVCLCAYPSCVEVIVFWLCVYPSCVKVVEIERGVVDSKLQSCNSSVEVPLTKRASYSTLTLNLEESRGIVSEPFTENSGSLLVHIVRLQLSF